jgi:hypothetical protein
LTTRGTSRALLLRIARKHLDYVVVQAIIKLPLKGPGKLLMLDFARLHGEKVRVDFGIGGFEANLYFDAVRRRARPECEERMFVALEFAANFVAKVIHHRAVSAFSWKRPARDRLDRRVPSWL